MNYFPTTGSLLSTCDRRTLTLPHPEGGYYRRTFASDRQVEAGSGRQRTLCTSIIYLLGGGQFSAFHRIKSDELWMLGESTTSLRILELQGDTLVETLLNRGQPFHCVKAHTWFAAEVVGQSGQDYVLAYCVVAPGFDFADFELANAELMSADYPAHAALWSRLCIR